MQLIMALIGVTLLYLGIINANNSIVFIANMWLIGAILLGGKK